MNCAVGAVSIGKIFFCQGSGWWKWERERERDRTKFQKRKKGGKQKDARAFVDRILWSADWIFTNISDLIIATLILFNGGFIYGELGVFAFWLQVNHHLINQALSHSILCVVRIGYDEHFLLWIQLKEGLDLVLRVVGSGKILFYLGDQRSHIRNRLFVDFPCHGNWYANIFQIEQISKSFFDFAENNSL